MDILANENNSLNVSVVMVVVEFEVDAVADVAELLEDDKPLF